MNTHTQRLSGDSDAVIYAPPAVEILGSFSELTAGFTGKETDSCGTGEDEEFHYSQTS